MKNNGIKHRFTAPYHPASNGAAENTVKTFKSKFKLLLQEGLSKKEALSKYLFHIRSTPHCTTGLTPAELQIGRKFRTRWDLLIENVKNKINKQQNDQKKNFCGSREINFEKDQVVMARDYNHKDKFKKSIIVQKLSPVTYNVKTHDNLVWKRHADQILPCKLDLSTKKISDEISTPSEFSLKGEESVCDKNEIINQKENVTKDNNVSNGKVNVTKNVELRRSARTPKPKKIFDL